MDNDNEWKMPAKKTSHKPSKKPNKWSNMISIRRTVSSRNDHNDQGGPREGNLPASRKKPKGKIIRFGWWYDPPRYDPMDTRIVSK